MAADIRIRPAIADDAVACEAIYRPIVLETGISFEWEPPSVDVFRLRIEQVTAKYPWLVALDDDEAVAGYAHANAHRDSPSYQWSVNTSVFIREDRRGLGLGKALYRDLHQRLASLGYVQAFAGVALPNAASVALHEAMGYRHLGTYENAGFKLGQWRRRGLVPEAVAGTAARARHARHARHARPLASSDVRAAARATHSSPGLHLLAEAGLHQLRRPGGADRADARGARGAAPLDLREALPACDELLHAVAGTGSAAARHLHRLADAPQRGRHRRGQPVRAAVAADPDRAVVGLHGVRQRAGRRGHLPRHQARRDGAGRARRMARGLACLEERLVARHRGGSVPRHLRVRRALPADHRGGRARRHRPAAATGPSCSGSAAATARRPTATARH